MLVPIALALLPVCAGAPASGPNALETWDVVSYHTQVLNEEVELREALIWDGVDFEEPSMYLNLHRSHQEPEANVEVLGLQDTGTNLLLSMLLLNFGQRLRYFDWSNPKNATGNFRNGLWKHANLEMKFEAEPQDVKVLTKQNVTALIMVRDPLSWLQSMRKAPYELGYCVMWSDFAESKWLNRKCRHPHPAGFQSIVTRTNFASLQQIWNNWTHAHMNADKYGFRSFVLIRYEDLIRDPFTQLDRIASTLGLQHSAPWEMRSKSAKSHGKSLGRRDALKKLKAKTYMDEYFPDQTTTACRLLDPQLLAANGYSDCTGILREAGVSNIIQESPPPLPAPDKAKLRLKRPGHHAVQAA